MDVGSGLLTSTLWNRARAGDAAARDELARRYLPLAHRLASRYRSVNSAAEDLQQVASLGLVIAIDRYDPERGVAFPAFAIPTILGELRRYFRDTGWSAHVPRGAQELALRCDAAAREMTSRTGRTPSVTEVAEAVGISVEDVVEGLEAAGAHYSVSLDAPGNAGHGQAAVLGEILGREDPQYDSVDARLSLTAGIRALPFQERRAVVLRLSHNLKQADIARRMGCSQMQVSRLLKRAATKLT